VDNGSTDGSVGRLRALFPDLRLIGNKTNLGFAAACNVGIRAAMEAGAEFVWLLNNDTVVDTDTLAELVRALQSRPAAAFAGSKIYYAARPDVLWFAGGDLPVLGSEPCHRGLDETDVGRHDEVTACGFVTGCSLLVRTGAIAAIGPMPEEYFVYWEDVDWNERAAAAGFERLYVPTSRVWHKVSAASADPAGRRNPLMERYNMRNAILFHRRHRPLGLAVAASRGVLRTLKLLLWHRQPVRSEAAFRGLIDGILGRTGPIGD
jgi:GT2 family glycosyltransferase